MRVLLVDDEVDLASALAERLDLRGIKADWVTTAQAAIDKADAVDYDLAILDVKMPKIGGLELRERLHERLGYFLFQGFDSRPKPLLYPGSISLTQGNSREIISAESSSDPLSTTMTSRLISSSK